MHAAHGRAKRPAHPQVVRSVHHEQEAAAFLIEDPVFGHSRKPDGQAGIAQHRVTVRVAGDKPRLITTIQDGLC